MKLKLTIAATLALALGVAALGSASTIEAKPKPGLTPGKWQGTGVIKGSVTDEVGTTKFSGKLGFRLTVARNLEVKGTGSWVKTMEGRGELVKSSMTGIGHMLISGHAHEIEFVYKEYVEGTVSDAFTSKPKPVKFVRGEDPPLLGILVINRARTCTATGKIPASGGLLITWTAKRLGKCTA